ncbi:MAG: hypothetical protein DRJ64_00680 [Thermoprotei archaeon]|nr:MAG: hypothetical protein DRJ64_00680 [Thermoprotei archaeon]
MWPFKKDIEKSMDEVYDVHDVHAQRDQELVDISWLFYTLFPVNIEYPVYAVNIVKSIFTDYILAKSREDQKKINDFYVQWVNGDKDALKRLAEFDNNLSSIGLSIILNKTVGTYISYIEIMKPKVIIKREE